MAEQKRFYWIKLKESFFINNDVTDWILAQPNGCEYIVLYLKLCLFTANKGGRLAMEIGEMLIPFDAQKIARETKFDIDTVIVAMELFKKIGLIYEEADGILKIPYVDEVVGSESSSAIRMRRSRTKKALEKSKNKEIKASHCDEEKKKEKREKILENRALDVEEEKTAPAETFDNNDYRNKLEVFKDKVILSDYQVEDLLNKMGLEVFDEYILRLNNYINKTGYTIKNHYETLLKWYTEDRGIKK